MKSMLLTTLTAALMCSTAMAADMMSNGSSTTTAPMNNNSSMSTMAPAAGSTPATTMDRTAMKQGAMDASGIVTAQNIKSLPADGQMVRIMGTVKDVKGSDKFTLSDGSTTVKVMTTSTASLAAGDKVTVTGKVDSGMMGKSIEGAEVKKGMDTSSLPYEVAANYYGHNGMSTGYEGGQISNGTMMMDSTTRTGEAAPNNNMENDNEQRVKPYTSNMSMNDYNARNKTSRIGQMNIQPESPNGYDAPSTMPQR